MSRANNGVKVTLNKVGKLISNADQPTLVVIVLVVVLVFIILWKLFFSKKCSVCERNKSIFCLLLVYVSYTPLMHL